MANDLEVMSLAFQASSPLIITDANQLIINVNEAFVALSGFGIDVMGGMALRDLYSLTGNNYTQMVEPGILEFLADPGDRRFYSGKTVRISSTGNVVNFVETITVVRDKQGSPIHYLLNFQDVTDLLQAEQALRESQQTYSSLMESMHDGVVLLDALEVLDCNQQFARMLLTNKSSIIGRSIAELSVETQRDGSDSKDKAVQVFKSVLGGRPGGMEWTMLQSNGQLVELDASLSPTTVDGKPLLLATVRDITARKLIESERSLLVEELAKKEEMIRLAGRASGVVSWLLDVSNDKFTWSDGAAESLGVKPQQLGDSLYKIKKYMGGAQRIAFENAMNASVSSGLPLNYVTTNIDDRDADAEARWFSVQGKVELNDRGEALAVRGTVSDITEQKHAEEEIARLAYNDPLTGLPNRRLLLDRLEQSCAHTMRRGTSGALLFIDLDRFKLLNDSLGHQVGDELLIKVGRRLKSSLRKEDTVARLGGDEFVVLLPSIDGDASKVVSRVRRIAGLLRREIARDYKIKDHSYHMSASIGVAIFPQDSSAADEILQQVDAAMYLAKKSGRDTVAFYHATLQTEADNRLALERDLRKALEREQFELYFQPKVDPDLGGIVVGAEALLRWNRGSEGLIMPDTFIPVAEETGLILGIGKWVLENACAIFANWNEGRDSNNLLGIAINVSPVQFLHRSFVNDVKRIIGHENIDPGLITLEITENTMIDNLNEAMSKLDELRKFGVRISIDDFGTGYSSLYYLKNLPLDEIKIDRIYVKDIIEDQGDAAIVASILAIADNLGLYTVAEGIETQAHAEYLHDIGCNLQQGYFYSKPISAEDFALKYVYSHGDKMIDAGIS